MNKDKTKRVGFIFFALFSSIIALNTSGCRPQDQAQTKEKITIAYPATAAAILSHIAFAKNYYSRQGLEAAAQPHEFGKLALQSVLDGKADIAAAADTPIMFAIMNGRDIVIIAKIQSSSKNEAIFTVKGRGIAKPSDLRGKKIGVTSGTTGDFFLDVFLLHHNVERNSVQGVNLTPAQMPEAIRTGKVDAVAACNPTLWQLQKAWGAKSLVFCAENILTESFYFVSTRQYAQNNPQAIKKLLRALREAEAFVNKYPEESQRLISDFLKADKIMIKELWDLFTPRVNLTQGLIVSLEDQTRWAIARNLTKRRQAPNYIDHIYLEGLKAVNPEAVRIIH